MGLECSWRYCREAPSRRRRLRTGQTFKPHLVPSDSSYRTKLPPYKAMVPEYKGYYTTQPQHRCSEEVAWAQRSMHMRGNA